MQAAAAAAAAAAVHTTTAADRVGDLKDGEGALATNNAQDGQVGDMDGEEDGFVLGEALAQSRPPAIDSRAWRAAQEAKLGESREDTKAEESPAKSPQKMAEDKNAAFLKYKRTHGGALNRKMGEMMKTLRSLKMEMAHLKDAGHDTREEIGQLQSQLDAKAKMRQTLTRPGVEDADVIDEEEYRLMKETRDAKRRFRESKKQQQETRQSIAEKKQELKRMRKDLLDDFETRYSDEADEDLDTDMLDYGEQFDQLEASKVMEEDPESLAFFKAQKMMRTSARTQRNQLKASLSRKRH